MFTEIQLQQLNVIAHSNPEVQMLLDFYLEAQADGVKTIRLSLNSQLLAFSKELTKKDCNYDFTYEKIIEVAKVMKKLPKPLKPEKEAKGGKIQREENTKKKGHTGKAVI